MERSNAILERLLRLHPREIDLSLERIEALMVDLGHPGRIIFDETYYAPNAYALLKYGVEWQVQEGGANPVNGAPLLGDGPAYVVHRRWASG